MAGLRKATIAQKIFPVICGSAFKNKGVQNMLDAVVDYLPSPLEVPPVKGIASRTIRTTSRIVSRKTTVRLPPWCSRS